MSTWRIYMSGSMRVHKHSCCPWMPEYSSKPWTLRIYACICTCRACEKCLLMELDVMKVIEADLIVVWIFCSFNDVFVSSWVYKMFMEINWIAQQLSQHAPSSSTYSDKMQKMLVLALTSMDADPNMYPILIPPASNTFHFFHHPQPHHTANPTTLNPSSIIHHLSSMATPDIELTQLPSQFSWYSIDSPPWFAHLLIQSSDPVLKTTHAIEDNGPIWNISSTMHIFRNKVNSPSWW